MNEMNAVNAIEQKLEAQHIALPRALPQAGNYKGFIMSSPFILTAGQLPLSDGQLQYIGRLGRDLTVEEGYAAARLCGINILSQLNVALDGNLARVKKCVKVTGFVSSDPAFYLQHKVLDGCSDLLVSIFGDVGTHARSAVGVAALPMNAAVEIEAMFEFS